MVGLGLGLCLGRGVVGPSGPAFSPLDLSPALWLDASDTATITQSSGLVSQWNDKSGNARHATQATGTNQPTTGTRTINGKNVLDFIGPSGEYWLNDFMDFVEITSPSNVTYFVVHAVDVLDIRRYIVGTSLQYYDPPVFALEATTGAGIILKGDAGTSLTAGTSSVNTPYIHVAQTGTSGSKIYKNGLLEGSNATPVTYTHAIKSIGKSNPDVFNNFYDGRIAEILIFPTALSSTNLNLVGNYLAAKWGITWTNI